MIIADPSQNGKWRKETFADFTIGYSRDKLYLIRGVVSSIIIGFVYFFKSSRSLEFCIVRSLFEKVLSNLFGELR